MGQYWKPVSLTKREYLEPHKLGTGLKLWEQLANHPGTGAALIVLCAAMPEPRGGGDLDLDKNWHGPERAPEHNTTPGPMPQSYPEIARQVIGRWAGDRIALVGDYAERGDLAPDDQAHLIYSLCASEEERQSDVSGLRKRAAEAREQGDVLYGRTAEELEAEAEELEKAQLYTDITDMVCQVIEHELQGKFVGQGWRDFERR